jgi:hypothetical protein
MSIKLVDLFNGLMEPKLTIIKLVVRSELVLYLERYRNEICDQTDFKYLPRR